MSDKKQSSVEWLEEKIQQANPSFKFDGLIRQAKAMHKKEIEDAYYNGGSYEDLTKNEILEIAEQFYNETYGG